MHNPLTAFSSSSPARLRENDISFIDQTAPLPRILASAPVVTVITRPRAFGKTRLLRTLRSFLDRDSRRSATREGFSDLAITSDAVFCTSHLGQHPVLFASLSALRLPSFEDNVPALASLVAHMANDLRQLLTSSRVPASLKSQLEQLLHLTDPPIDRQVALLPDSLQLMAQALAADAGQPVIVLIDAYDTPFLEAAESRCESVAPLLQQILANVLNDPCVEKAVVAGRLPVVLTGLAPDRVVYHTLADDRFADAASFSLSETRQILARFGLSAEESVVRERFGGRRIGGTDVFCPIDILGFCRSRLLNNPLFENRWLTQMNLSSLRRFLQTADTEGLHRFKALLAGESVSVRLMETFSVERLASTETDAQLSRLYHEGWLALERRGADSTATLRVANPSTRYFVQVIADRFLSDRSPELQAASAAFASHLASGDARAINAVLCHWLPRLALEKDARRDMLLSLLQRLFACVRQRFEHTEKPDGTRLLHYFVDAASRNALRAVQSHPCLTQWQSTGGLLGVQRFGLACCGDACETVAARPTPIM